MKRYFFIFSTLMLLASCNRDTGWNCTRTLGNEITESRYIGHFTQLITYDRVDIAYRYADSCYVEVTYGKNMIGQIGTEREGHRLIISNNTTCNFIRNISVVPRVVIYAPTLSYIENHSAADITTLDTLRAAVFKYQQYAANGEVKLLLKTDTAKIYAHTGYTGITLIGSSFTAELYSASTGKFDASQFIAHQAYVNNTSIQDIRCVALDYLYAVIKRSGDIRYSGDPNLIETSLSGSGSLIAE